MHKEPVFRKASPARAFIGRLEYGDDLLETLLAFCIKQKITLGAVQVIGAVQCARLGYYDQRKKRYTGCVAFDRKLEIASCGGNVSLKDGNTALHLHIALADYKGKAFGGHLMPGTKVFAAEFFVQELSAARKLCRKPDPVTGLPLWARK